MAKTSNVTKRVQIDKTQSAMMATIIIASIITIFCLVSAKALLSEAAYQRKVVNLDHAAVAQLKQNVSSAQKLETQYNQVFEGTNPQNIIGGQNTSSPSAVPPNGDNARIVLDALPSSYDFPALLSSVYNMMSKDGISNQSVTGTDEQASIDANAAASPQPQQIQLTISGSATADNVEQLTKDLERSIRPFDVTNIQLSGTGSQLTFSLTANTYFQPAKSLSVTTKEIK